MARISACRPRWNLILFFWQRAFLRKWFTRNPHGVYCKKWDRWVEWWCLAWPDYWLVNTFCITVSLKCHHYAARHSESTSLQSITARIMIRVSVGRNAQEIWWIDIKFIEKCVADNQLILLWFVHYRYHECNSRKLSANIDIWHDSSVDTLTDMLCANIIRNPK